jgi:hypothetical protein
MGISIASPGAQAATSGIAAAGSNDVALQAQVDASQSAIVAALFGSLGLGTKTNTTA